MALSYRSRKLLAVLVLVIGMPVYVVVAVNLIAWADDRWGRLSTWSEFAVFVGLGVIWILPLKSLFKGIGQPDPDAPNDGPNGPKA